MDGETMSYFDKVSGHMYRVVKFKLSVLPKASSNTISTLLILAFKVQWKYSGSIVLYFGLHWITVHDFSLYFFAGYSCTYYNNQNVFLFTALWIHVRVSFFPSFCPSATPFAGRTTNPFGPLSSSAGCALTGCPCLVGVNSAPVDPWSFLTFSLTYRLDLLGVFYLLFASLPWRLSLPHVFDNFQPLEILVLD